MTRDQLANQVEAVITATDADLLNELGVTDEVMSIMAAEHAARTKALLKLVDPTFGRALLLMLSGALLSAAKEIDAVTEQQPELVNV